MSLTNAATLNYNRPAEGEKPGFAGLSVSAWLTIGIVGFLMLLTFRFNLVRLWGKTNPFTGEGEWQHAFLVPLIGLYFLYVNREELLSAKVEPLMAGKYSMQAWVGALLAIGGLLVRGLRAADIGPPVLSTVAYGLMGTGLLVLAFDKALQTGDWWKQRLYGAAGAAIAGVAVMVLAPVLVPGQAGTLASGGKLLIVVAGLVMALDWGLAMTVFGLAFFTYGIWPGQNDYFKDLGMVCTLFGVVLTLCGWKVMRVAWFPIAFLICALPWPGLFYSWLASPLQVLAAKVAVGVLQFTGIEAFQSGSKINMNGTALNVAEACAGLKSLMTFVTLGAALGFLSSRPLWQRLAMMFSAVPIAVFCNVMRVTVQGLLAGWLPKEYAQEWSENFAHQFVGMVMLIPAFFMILAFGWLLDKLFLEEADEEATRAVKIAAGATKDLTVVAPAAAGAVPAVAAPMAAIPVRAVKANTAAAIAERAAASEQVADGEKILGGGQAAVRPAADAARPAAAAAKPAAVTSEAGVKEMPAVAIPPVRGTVLPSAGPRRGGVAPVFTPPGAQRVSGTNVAASEEQK